MIKNDRQYQAAKRAMDGLTSSLQLYPTEAPAESGVHPRLWAAERDALAAQIDELREDVRMYDDLRSGARRVIEVRSWADVPRALIEGRIAANLTQRELGLRLELPEQAIQRYEANDYASASLRRLQEVANAIGLTLTGLAAVADGAPTSTRLVERINELGVDKKWFAERLLPASAAEAIFGSFGRGKSGTTRFAIEMKDRAQPIETALVQAADVFHRVFEVAPSKLFGNSPLQLNEAVVGHSRFKRSAGKLKKGSEAYTFYAHYVALLTLEACKHLPRRQMPSTAPALAQSVRDEFGSLSFECSLRFVWAHGIPVLPLSDVGAFHGACWRTGGREVIVLKQRTNSEDRWLYDLWHEVAHVVDESEGERFAIVEDEIPAAQDPKEQRAMAIAGDVVLDGRADELALRAMALVHDDVRMLSRVVPRVANEAGVATGALANHLAFRIAQDSDGKINWWGSAAKLQRTSNKPWTLARDILLEHIDFSAINASDRDILARALAESADELAVSEA